MSTSEMAWRIRASETTGKDVVSAKVRKTVSGSL